MIFADLANPVNSQPGPHDVTWLPPIPSTAILGLGEASDDPVAAAGHVRVRELATSLGCCWLLRPLTSLDGLVPGRGRGRT